MRLLILGGTWFLGRTLAERAVKAGHAVTTFTRGRTAPDVAGVRPVHGDRTDPADLARVVSTGPYDAVVDTSGTIPADVLRAATALAESARRYVYVSSVNAYEGWPTEPLSERSAVRACPPDATAAPDAGAADRYGRLKAGCENAAGGVYGDRALILRPGVILGPYEYIGRAAWWLNRMARDGRVLCPGDPERGIQPIDVRDVAGFILHAVGVGLHGAYNVAAPIDHTTYGAFLSSCAHAVGTDPEMVWADDQFLLDQGVAMWTELPLWRTYRGTWTVDTDKARTAGLGARPIAETVADTWAWLKHGGDGETGERARELGIDADVETQLLDRWSQRRS